jgi:hypothetical protein
MKAFAKWVGLVTLLVLAVTAWPVAALTPCVQYITTAADDAPNSGYLFGTRTETTSSTFSYSGSWSYLNFGGVFNGSSTRTQTYEVGVYRMDDGTYQNVRCDTYMPV